MNGTAVCRQAGEQADCSGSTSMGDVLSLLDWRHPGRFGGSLPDFPHCGGGSAQPCIELAENHPFPILSLRAFGRAGVKQDLAADLIGQIERLCGMSEISLVRKDVGRGGNVAHHNWSSFVGLEVLGCNGVQCRPQLGGGTLDVPRGEAHTSLDKRRLRMERCRSLEPLQLREGTTIV